MPPLDASHDHDDWIVPEAAKHAAAEADDWITPDHKGEPDTKAAAQVTAADLKPGDRVMIGDQPHEVEKVRPWTGDQIAVKLKGDPKLHIGPPDAPVRRAPKPGNESQGETGGKSAETNVEASQNGENESLPPAAEPEPITGKEGGISEAHTESKSIEAHGGPWTPAGKNHAGETVYENPHGLRAVMEGGVPYTEASTQTAKGMAPKNAGNRKPQFMVEADTAARNPKDAT